MLITVLLSQYASSPYADLHSYSQDAHHIRDATLTALGKFECAKLQETLPLYDMIDRVLSSPLRRAVQTAVLSFSRTIA